MCLGDEAKKREFGEVCALLFLGRVFSCDIGVIDCDPIATLGECQRSTLTAREIHHATNHDRVVVALVPSFANAIEIGQRVIDERRTGLAVNRIRAEIGRTTEVARQVFNERVKRRAAKLLKEAEESA